MLPCRILADKEDVKLKLGEVKVLPLRQGASAPAAR